MELTSGLIVFSSGLVAGLFGAIVGGSLLLIVPILTFVGLPIHTAIGTAKLSAVFRDVPALFNYHRSREVVYEIGGVFTLFAIIATFLGAQVSLGLSEESLKLVVSTCIIGVAVAMLWDPKAGLEDYVPRRKSNYIMLNMISGSVCGIYAGVFGGGVNFLIIYSFVALSGLPFRAAVATSKVSNLSSTIVATTVFIWFGRVDYILAIPLCLGMTLGGYLGSRWAIQQDNRTLRLLFVLAAIIIAVKLLLFA